MALFRRNQPRVQVPSVSRSAAELYHYRIGAYPNLKRVHLRVERDGSAVLVINAAQMAHLNPTAALMARLLLDDVGENRAIATIRKFYQVDKQQAAADFADFKRTFDQLVSPHQDVCPVCDLELELFEPFSRQPSAPYRMDLALTYRCNNRCAHCYNQPSRAESELNFEEWKAVLDKVWQLGIPHVIFTGGEPTLVAKLPELVTFAEKLGLITGLNTNGRRLSDAAFVDELVAAGLDHVQITLESHDAVIHDRIVGRGGALVQTRAGIRNALASRLFVMTNTTLLRRNSAHLPATLQFLSDLGVPTIGLNGLIHSGRGAAYAEGLDESDLPALLEQAQTHTQASGQRLIWYTPTQYCHFNPLDSGLGVKGCTAALYNMCVEPDGGVLPCQSYYQTLGNFLTDDWERIWLHDLPVSIRERRYASDNCRGCELFSTCGGGCPLYVASNPAAQPQPFHALKL